MIARPPGNPSGEWPRQPGDEIAKHEGLPLSVEGYIARAQWEGKESCNCKSDEPEMRDMHLWLTKEPTRDRSESIVVEVTPRLRAKHPRWTTSALKRIAERHERVRISGWLMFDGEHPDQVGKTRGTLLEIHPVMRIEVLPPRGLGKSGHRLNSSLKQDNKPQTGHSGSCAVLVPATLTGAAGMC